MGRRECYWYLFILNNYLIIRFVKLKKMQTLTNTYVLKGIQDI